MVIGILIFVLILILAYEQQRKRTGRSRMFVRPTSRVVVGVKSPGLRIISPGLVIGVIARLPVGKGVSVVHVGGNRPVSLSVSIFITNSISMPMPMLMSLSVYVCVHSYLLLPRSVFVER